MQKVFFLVGFFILLISCQSEIPSSKLTTTSNKLKEFGYQVSGQIELPLDRHIYQLAYLFDLYRYAFDHPEDQAFLNKLESSLSSSHRFNSDFYHEYQSIFPVIDNLGQIDLTKLQYWVDQQVRYSFTDAEDLGIALTLSSLTVKSYKKNPSLNTIVINYEAKLLGANANFVRTEDSDNFEVGSLIHVPINPFDFYFRTMDNEFYTLYQKVQSDKQSISSLLKTSLVERLIEQTAKGTKNCYEPDGDAVGPNNYFWYFKSEQAACQDFITDKSSLQVLSVQEELNPTSYPEYHRLFSDKKVSAFYFYNDYDGYEEGEAQHLINWLIEKGYTRFIPSEGLEFGDKYQMYQKNVDGVEFTVRLSIGSPTKQLFKDAIKTDEIIIYSGHSGYGFNISEFFGKKDYFPANTYQLFMMDGCSTYPYAMSKITDQKRQLDNDIYQHNFDVITTQTAVAGSLHSVMLLELIESATSLYQQNNWTEANHLYFKENFSWLPIITAINMIADQLEEDNGIFMVSGEVFNEYSPGRSQQR